MVIALHTAMAIAFDANKKLGAAEKLIILTLILLMEESKQEYILISAAHLGVYCQMSPRSIQRLMKGLVLKGKVIKTQQYDHLGRPDMNKYQVNGYKPKKEIPHDE